jgi:hypothetical protein
MEARREKAKRSLLSLLALLGLALFLTGCGGGESTTFAAVPTRAEFVKKANAICVKAEAERRKALKTSPLEPLKKQLNTAQQNELILQSALPPVREMAEDLAKLTPPAGEEQQVEEFVKGLEAAVRRSEKRPQDALSGAAFVEVDKKIKTYGLSLSCSI